MGLELPIDAFPVELTVDDAVQAAYGEDLDWLRDKLTQGLSVLLECDKQATLYLYRALRSRFRAADEAGKRRLALISGHATGGEAMRGTLTQRLLTQLEDAVFAGDREQIIVLPHLDILATVSQRGMSAETREVAALLYENPDAVYLAFKDPSFELPKVVENVFPARRSLLGLSREVLARLITRREARKLAHDTFNPFRLYKYLSGVNAIRCRQILSHFHNRLDFDPAAPQSADDIFREIREMTVVGDVELPRVDLDKDVGGYEAVKTRMREEVLDLLALKDRSRELAEIKNIEQLVPKGLIFHGPPGTGKTFFAKAMATALDATILIVSGPELKSMWVGESEANLRRVFHQARSSAPSIIVFDELDSFAGARTLTAGSTGVEHSMVNQLLTEMDGFRREELVFIVGTTNFLESLDPALLRPGRFELSIEIPPPTDEDRKAIFEIYLGKFGLEADADVVEHVVQRTAGVADASTGQRYTGDHLYALVRALKRERLRQGQTGPVDRDAVDRALGGKKASVRLQAEEERTIAVHEAGHAVLAYVLPHCPTIEKVSIATGDDSVLGYVMSAVRKNKYVTTERELLDDLCVLLGGRCAESLILSSVSMGAYSDLQRANELARVMVQEMGLSPEVGLRAWPTGAEDQGIGVSASKLALIDAEIDRILERERARAEETLRTWRRELEALESLLLDKKTIGLDEIREVFGGRSFKQSAAGGAENRKEES